MTGRVVVVKLGSSVLPDEDALPDVVRALYAAVRAGDRVVAVVSALGRHTDALVDRARAFGPAPSARATAALVATGEATAVALVALALDRAGIPVVPLAGAGIVTAGDPLDGDPVRVDPTAIRAALDRAPIVVVPGFVARDVDGAPSLLGRGGSDLTALLVAEALGATCRLVKDVGGVYDADPRVAGAVRYASVTWDDAARCAGRAIQPKALAEARARGIRFDVGGLDGPATAVGADHTRVAGPAPADPPLRVTLLGLGTVGGGVWRALRRWPERFRVVAAAVRDPARHAGDGLPGGILHRSPWDALDVPSDVVVEAVGGLEPAATLVAAAIADGRAVVTANKHLVAVHGRSWPSGAVRYSASVGGAVPAIEAATRLRGRVSAVEGVLNGTSSVVLDALGAGATLADAIAVARDRGLCEADPTLDLDGTDAAHKLTILVRHAFGAEPDAIAVTGIDPAAATGRIRLMARARREGDAIVARVGPERLDPDHPLGALRGEDNGVVLHTVGGGREVVTGRGAGRWPTAAAVVADLFDLRGAR